MIQALCSANNLRARAEKILKKPLFKQTHKVTFHIITSLGVVFSLSTLISKLPRAKIIGSFKLQASLWLADLFKLRSAKVAKVGGIRNIMVLWRAVFLAASLLVTAPPSNLTRLHYNGSAAKSHSTTAQYSQLRRLRIWRIGSVSIFPTRPRFLQWSAIIPDKWKLQFVPSGTSAMDFAHYQSSKLLGSSPPVTDKHGVSGTDF